MSDYQKYMDNAFATIEARDILTTPGNYWQQGCILDTVIDYFKFSIQKGTQTKSDAQAFMKSVFLDCYMQAGYEQAGCWYDDFGWWGIASSKAYDSSYDDVFGSYIYDYQNIAMHCWNIMKNGKKDQQRYKGAPNVWDNCDQTYFASVAPRIKGGVWQYEIFQNQRDNECSPFNPANPLASGVTLGPYQLTVVNTLYFVLGGRLAEAGQVDWTDVDTQYSFFSQWIRDQNISSKDNLLNSLAPNVNLVRERVSTYANGSQVQYWDDQTAWGGDQGMFMGGMVIYNNKYPHIAPNSIMINSIASGVQQHMENSGVIQPWYPTGTGNKLYQWDKGDYSSGCGVYMRYLLFSYLNDNSGNLQSLVKASYYQNFLRASADAYATDNPPNFGNANFQLFDQLSVLLTAIQLLD